MDRVYEGEERGDLLKIMSKKKIIKQKSIILFEDAPVRRIWSDKEEKWYFSIVDVVRILAQNNRPRKYWDDLKRKLKQEGFQLSEKIGQLKLLSKDGKKYLTDVTDTETMFRIIQSIPSPKAEPLPSGLKKIMNCKQGKKS